MSLRMYRSKGFCLSLNANARQAVLMAHGAWSTKDGQTQVPTGTKLVHFYTAHQEYGKRAAAYAVLAAGRVTSYQGVVDPVRMVQAKSQRNATGTLTLPNYDLSCLEGEDDVWNAHQSMRTNYWDADLDLIILENNREAHLSDAFAVAHEANGRDYEVMHCCHCRYVEPSK